MQGICSGIDAYIGRGHLLPQLLFRSGSHIVDHATPAYFFNKVHER